MAPEAAGSSPVIHPISRTGSVFFSGEFSSTIATLNAEFAEHAESSDTLRRWVVRYNRGAIVSLASADVMTGWTSNSTRSLQLAIH